jgi:hypothetical protein
LCIFAVKNICTPVGQILTPIKLFCIAFWTRLECHFLNTALFQLQIKNKILQGWVYFAEIAKNVLSHLNL